MKDVIIVGAGPAGLTAGLYAARAGLKTLILAGAELGGQLLLTDKIENFPGFLAASGVDLIETIKKQAEEAGAEISQERVLSVNLTHRPFEVKTENHTYEAKTLILATGAKARWLGVNGEDKFKGKGISVCATCDGFFYRGKKVAVIGGGSSAIYEALLLMKMAREVVILCREDSLAGDDTLIKRLKENPAVQVMYRSEVKAFLGDKKLEKIKLVQGNSEREISVDGAFVAIGSDADSDLVKGQLKRDKWGLIKTDKQTGSTSVAGVFAAGDVQQSGTRQAILAAASGCLSALSAKAFLLGK
ncbi:MAG: thioredoxin-disulfide reductase [Alphaproteobacteria bacterium]